MAGSGNGISTFLSDIIQVHIQMCNLSHFVKILYMTPNISQQHIDKIIASGPSVMNVAMLANCHSLHSFLH